MHTRLSDTPAMVTKQDLINAGQEEQWYPHSMELQWCAVEQQRCSAFLFTCCHWSQLFLQLISLHSIWAQLQTQTSWIFSDRIVVSCISIIILCYSIKINHDVKMIILIQLTTILSLNIQLVWVCNWAQMLCSEIPLQKELRSVTACKQKSWTTLLLHCTCAIPYCEDTTAPLVSALIKLHASLPLQVYPKALVCIPSATRKK